MSELLNVNGKEYLYIFDYKDNEILRRSFNNLTQKTYGFDFEDDTLYLNDVFGTQDISLDSIIDALINKKTKIVVLGFTPRNTSSFEVNLLKEEDTTLFIKSAKDNPFEDNKLMFSILSHV